VVAAEMPEPDADQDGLSDQTEERLGTSPVNPDTDGDGYLDGEELRAAYSPTSTAPVRLSKSILINVKTSRLEQRVGNIPIASFPISAGLPRAPTPVGNFMISSKHPRASLVSNKNFHQAKNSPSLSCFLLKKDFSI